MVKYSVAVVTILSMGAATSLNLPVAAEPAQGSASDLRLAEEATIEPFEFNAEELDQLSTQINHSVNTDMSQTQQVQILRRSQELEPPSNRIVIDSSNNPATSREAPLP
ncbi:hypothetical protein [Thermocoleostomius sinensis]|uniref:Uncharacterized protein n=1 Tax=Thermocoleostomius sinensis A174 TaxID=2016057 RepID=A0A9E8ZJC6_9CYAN|nr:hypothetical protein [Thermocoleostomius sinensis]WAL62318.1 hypothetical protein OXH18_10105 [Thermocoleostomius sinensis A174]